MVLKEMNKEEQISTFIRIILFFFNKKNCQEKGWLKASTSPLNSTKIDTV